MKELYIRKGNSISTKNIIIIGEESFLGGRDIAYKPNKGSVFKPLEKKDKYSGGSGLTYVHAVPNISLDTYKYQRDYDVHRFVKEYCTGLVEWDGETNQGYVRSREAFVSKKKDIQKVCNELYKRIEIEVHGKVPQRCVVVRNLFKAFWWVLKFPFRAAYYILVILFGTRKMRRKLFKH